jgi:hypothetical protein
MLAACAALLTWVPALVEAQGRPQTREGFFVGFGLGAGSLGCEDCGERETGGAGYIKLGGTLSPQILLGAESNAWTKDIDGVRLTHAIVAAIVQFYPSATAGFFLNGGVGLARIEASASSGGFSGSVSEDALGLLAGLGYDIRLGSNFSLSPSLSFALGNFEDGSTNHATLALGATFH